jgi:hypothetical protein
MDSIRITTNALAKEIDDVICHRLDNQPKQILLQHHFQLPNLRLQHLTDVYPTNPALQVIVVQKEAAVTPVDMDLK